MSIIAENRINKIYQYIESGPYTIEFNLEFYNNHHGNEDDGNAHDFYDDFDPERRCYI